MESIHWKYETLNAYHKNIDDSSLETSFPFQLLIFMALAEGKSRVKCGEITLHTKTAISVAQLLTKVSRLVAQLLTELCHSGSDQCSSSPDKSKSS